MHRERLERLAVLLDAYKDEGATKFDLGTWGRSVQYRGGFLWLRKHTCNTAACAVGLACLSGEFSHDGLRYGRTAYGGLYPIFAGVKNWDAVAEFFELTGNQAIRLFESGSYRGEVVARDAARRIRALIKPRKRKAKPRSTDITSLKALLVAPSNDDHSELNKTAPLS